MWRPFYLLFRTISGVSLWVQRRFTRAGLLAVCALILTAVFGVDTSLTLAYQIFTLLLALLAVALVSAWFGRTPLAVQARLPHTLTAGEHFVLRFMVRNTSDALLDGVALRTELSDLRPTLAVFRSGLRFPTYRGWINLVGANRVAEIEEAVVPALPARGTADILAHGIALRRGRLRITGIDSARTEALGLMRRLLPASGAADICVLPKRYPLHPCRCRVRAATSRAACRRAARWATPKNSSACATTAPATRCSGFTGAVLRAPANRWSRNTRMSSSRAMR